MAWPIQFLVGGWTNPFETYARQNGFIFPNFRGKNGKIFELPPPRFPKSPPVIFRRGEWREWPTRNRFDWIRSPLFLGKSWSPFDFGSLLNKHPKKRPQRIARRILFSLVGSVDEPGWNQSLFGCYHQWVFGLTKKSYKKTKNISIAW